MNFTPTYDNLQQRQPFLATHYNTLIDDIQSYTFVSGDFTYPFTFGGSIGIASGASLFGFSSLGARTSSSTYAQQWAAGGGFYPGNDGAANASGLQAIIDALPSSGSSIQLGPGSHDITTTIELDGSNNGVGSYVLQGMGMGITTITAAVGHSGAVLRFTDTPGSQTPSNIIIRDLTINCAQLADYGIDMSSASRCQLINVEVKNANDSGSTGDGVYLNNTQNCRLENVYTHNNDRYGVFIQDGNGNCEGNEFIRVEADTNGADGFRGASGGINNTFVHCKSHGNTAYGFYFTTTTNNDCQQLELDHCKAYENAAGFYLVGGSATTEHFESLIISNCKAFSNSGNGFELQGAEGGRIEPGIRFFSIMGNLAFDNDGDGLLIMNSVCHGSVVGGAYCHNDQGSSGTYAGVRVSDDYVGGGGAAPHFITIVGVNASSASTGGNQHWGIYLQDTGSGYPAYITVQGCTADANDGNDLEYDDATGHVYVIQEDGATANSVTNLATFGVGGGFVT